MAELGTTLTGPELLVDLGRGDGPVRARLEEALRDAIRRGRLGHGARLPSSRTLALDLGVSRRLVVDAYGQLVAEGWLQARQGAGTVVGTATAGDEGPGDAWPPPLRRPRYDFFPGSPDLSAFPRALWARTAREVLLHAPDEALHYPDPAGTPQLRGALAAYLGRVRHVQAPPAHLVVTTGARQALVLVARALGRSRLAGSPARIAVEDPTLPLHAAVIRATGATVVRVPVDQEGLDVAALERAGADAVVVTPAHQFPLGMALSPERRAALLAWAADGERLIVEDDYDAEFRYDRRPLGALQGQGPGCVAYVGSASKALAPGLRLGWIAAPADLVEKVRREKGLDDGGSGVLDQLVLARLLQDASYDRHVRTARRRNHHRRATLRNELEVALPGARLEGMEAGLHAIVRLAEPVDLAVLRSAAAARSVGVYPLAAPGDARATALIVGYAALSEPALRSGVPLLAEAVAEATVGR